MMKIRSKFIGHCALCPKQYHAGDWIDWERNRTSSHWDCFARPAKWILDEHTRKNPLDAIQFHEVSNDRLRLRVLRKTGNVCTVWYEQNGQRWFVR